MTKMHGQKPAGHDANAVDGFRMTGKYVKADQAQLTMPSAAFAILMTAVLDKSAPFRFQAAGFSMTPFIRSGDVITIAPTSAPIRFGDVVAFENLSSGKLVVHRVVRVSSDSYIIKGDNSPESDEVVPVSRILGRVARVERCGKRVRLGSGIERIAIACLSRRRWLTPIVRTAYRFARRFSRRNS
jgi:signal peptidase I